LERQDHAQRAPQDYPHRTLRYFRHPIYSGLDLAALGGASAIDEWRCVVAVGLIVLAYWIKAKREESMLARHFGAVFEAHRRHTGFPIPRF
jgi:protein-S-isoprenylcysteine O-methyltransferase Ste14